MVVEAVLVHSGLVVAVPPFLFDVQRFSGRFGWFLHAFATGETARQVWSYFQKYLGLGGLIRGIRQVCFDWWGRCPKSMLRVGSGVCSEGGTLQQLIDQMMADCRRWCCMKRPWQVVVESNDERVLERVGRLEVFITSRCGEGVNCVVGYLVDKMEGWNVIYAKLNALPRSFRIQLDLGGLPHFCWGPEAEFSRKNISWHIR
nr:uncharacterized protein LOC109185694 [Ipomoea batatas]